ncbi:MAG: TonB-dependent receptor, partial [Alteraurantiacibacter sp.]
GLPGSTDLFFDDFVTVDLRTFVDLGERDWLVDAVPFFKDTRVSFDVENILDARQRVTDSNGDVPLRYQPFRVDPVGRSFEIEFRKVF